MFLWLLFLLSVGLYGAVSVSYETWSGQALCPLTFGIRACYIVTLGYAGMLFFSLFEWRYHKASLGFAGAWLPIFLFALVGSVLEWQNGSTCPKSEGQIPLCYYSLTLAVMVGLLFFMIQRRSKLEE